MKVGDKVKPSAKANEQGLFKPNYRQGKVIRIRKDGLIVVRWGLYKTLQDIHPDFLEVIL